MDPSSRAGIRKPSQQRKSDDYSITRSADGGHNGKGHISEVILFIHGLGGNVTHWLHIAPQFVDRYRVIAMDLPGCGQTPALSSGYSIDAYAQQVLGLLDRLGIAQAIADVAGAAGAPS